MREPLIVEIFGASGDPGGESLPFYSDSKAPYGNWLFSEKATDSSPIQKSLRNGTRLVMVDPEKVPTIREKASNVPLWDCEDGKPFFNRNGYCRVWLYNPETGYGEEIVKGQSNAWCEMSHLRPVKTETEPETGPEAGYAVSDLEAAKALGVLIRFVVERIKGG